MTNTPVLSIQNLSHRFGHTQALDNLSFSVAPNQIVGLLGRNGAGKSTLLRVVSGQLKPNSGDAAISDAPVFDSVKAMSQLCMIGDTPDFGKLKNIAALHGVCASLFPLWDRDYFNRLTERFELPGNKALKGFSRGMQTALLLSVGLASGAPLTVFDEPSLGLDAVMRERFYDLLLEERRKESGRTFILSTHLIDEVARVLDSAVLIDKGRLLCEGTIEEITAPYLSVSGAPEAVRDVTAGLTILREEEMAGSLVRHVRLNGEADGARIAADGRVQCAPMNLQRLFVFLTEKEEADRHATNA